MPRGRPTWTPELSAHALALYGQTVPILTREEIAQRLGVTFFALRGQLSRMQATRPTWTRGRGMWSPSGRVSHVTHHITCLGPLGPSHTFPSDDPKRHRICNRCRVAMAGVIEECVV